MTDAIVLGGRVKLSRRTSSLGKSFVWRWAWTCKAWWRSRHGQGDDDVFDMLCPNQKTRDVLTISTLGLLVVQICWTILKKKKLERLLDEGALTECSGTGERCVHLETALAAPHSCSGRSPLPVYLECKQCCHVLRGALRAVEEIVDDIVLTLAGLSLDPLKEKHLTTKSGRRRKLCEDYKKASLRRG